MKGIPRGKYTKEFRQEAVKLVTDENLSLVETARRLSLPPSTVANWLKAHKAGKLGDIGKTQKPLTEIEMERDILKKQPRTLPGSRCPVRDDTRTATPIPGTNDGEDNERFGQRLLRLGGPAAVEAGQGGNAFGTRD